MKYMKYIQKKMNYGITMKINILSAIKSCSIIKNNFTY